MAGRGRSPAPRPHQRRRGQALVEFALLGLILVLMLAGAVDLGRAFTAWIAMGNMARAGAQYGTIVPLVDPSSSDGISVSEIEEDMRAAALAEQPSIFGSTPTVTADWVSGNDCLARVTVTYDLEPILQIPPIPNSITLERKAQMRIQYVPPGYSCST